MNESDFLENRFKNQVCRYLGWISFRYSPLLFSYDVAVSGLRILSVLRSIGLEGYLRELNGI